MIFTGVTGGEIVSLLYPLFILSPFCYIIISKESLDGAPYVLSRYGDLQPAQEDRAWLYPCRHRRRGGPYPLYGDDRGRGVQPAGAYHVPYPGGGGYDRERL